MRFTAAVTGGRERKVGGGVLVKMNHGIQTVESGVMVCEAGSGISNGM